LPERIFRVNFSCLPIQEYDSARTASWNDSDSFPYHLTDKFRGAFTSGKRRRQKIVLGKFIKSRHTETLPGSNAAFCWAGLRQVPGKIFVQYVRFLIGHFMKLRFRSDSLFAGFLHNVPLLVQQ
jgi:hypothetical protein